MAPHIFMMAISSLRLKVASLMVLEMMKSDTSSRITTKMTATAPAMLRTTTKPSAISSSARTLAMPAVPSTCATVSSIRWISSTWMR